MKFQIVAFLSLAILASAGCGSSTDSAAPASDALTVAGSCTMTGTGGSCIEYGGAAYAASTATLQTSCTGTMSGTWATTACTATGRLGCCKQLTTASASSVTTCYYNSSLATTGQAQCVSTAGTTATWTAN